MINPVNLIRGSRATAYLELVFGAALILFAWSQNWFDLKVALPSSDSDELFVSGQQVASGLSGLALTVLALVAAISLATVSIQRILGGLGIVLSVAIFLTIVFAISNPLQSAHPLLVKLTGVANSQQLSEFVTSSALTLFPFLAFCGTVIIFLGSLNTLLSAPEWKRSSARKFERTQPDSGAVGADSAYRNVDSWDAISRGGDPTIQ